MTKRLLGIIIVALVVGLLSAAGFSAPRTVEITIGAFSGPECDAHKRLAGEFERYTDGRIKVKVEEIARQMYDTKILAVVSPRSTPYDVLITNAERVEAWTKGRLLAALDDFMKDPKLFEAAKFNLTDYPKAMLDLFRREGKLYAIPQEASAIMMFYRKDLFKKYGLAEPPEHGFSWDEYFDTAKKLKAALEKDGVKGVYATVHSGKRSVHVARETEQTLWTFGEEFLNANFRPVFTTPKARDAIKLYLSQHLVHGLTPPGVTGYEYPEVLTSFQQGQAAMAIEWNAAAPTFLDSSKSPITAGKTGFTVFPYHKDLGPDTPRIFPSIHAVAMTAGSKHKSEAFEYIAWFTSKEIARDYVVNGGGSSGRKSLLTDPSITAKCPWYPTLQRSMALYHPIRVFPELRYVTEELFAARLNGALAKEMSVDEAIDTAAREIERYLGERGYYK